VTDAKPERRIFVVEAGKRVDELRASGTVLIIDDPHDTNAIKAAAARAYAEGMDVAIVNPEPLPHGYETIDLKPEEIATLGPLTVGPRSGERELEHLRHLEKKPAAYMAPEHVTVSAELESEEFKALGWALAALKPRTDVARNAISALRKILASRKV
jgi:hypothetical protein